MKIIVFGATGGIGVVRQALGAGHAVTAVVRDAARFSLEHSALKAAVATEPERRRSAAPSIGGMRRCGDLLALVRAAQGGSRRIDRHTQHPARHGDERGVRRLVAVSAVPVGPTPAGESFLNRRILLPLVGFADLYIDLSAMEDEIRRSATMMIVRPPKLTNKPLTGVYRTCVGANVPRGYAISRANAAHAMLAALGDPATIRQAVGIAN